MLLPDITLDSALIAAFNSSYFHNLLYVTTDKNQLIVRLWQSPILVFNT
jgi:hypothetical protein